MAGDEIGMGERPTIDFGRTAVDYETHRPGFPDEFFDRLAARRWISRGQRPLDLGTGTGSLALGFASRGVITTGLDIAPELLEVARQATAAHGLPARFVEGRAQDTGQESGTSIS